jgi:pimeloyl-ACP methyl ester carboxylesterase
MQSGLLPPGIYVATIDEVVERFGEGDTRRILAHAFEELGEFAAVRGATRVILGGSFVSGRRDPADLDVVVVFARESQIPAPSEQLEVRGGAYLDIYFAAEEQPEIVNSFIELFSATRYGEQSGIIIVTLPCNVNLAIPFEPVSGDLLALVRRIYANRRSQRTLGGKTHDRALVLVHGLKSHGEWYSHVTEIASARDWIVAPFSYGHRWLTALLLRNEQRAIIDEFRRYVYAIYERYQCDISVIAHSFGTFVTMSYLVNFDDPPVDFDTVIFTGSILNPEFDLSLVNDKLVRLVNEKSPNDNAVKWAPILRVFNPSMGPSGVDGFSNDAEFLVQRECSIFTHHNVIDRDVVYQRWLPELEAHSGASRRRKHRSIGRS